MKRLEQIIGFHSIIAVFAMVIFTIFSCSVYKMQESNNTISFDRDNVLDSLSNYVIPFKSVYIDKAKIRIDYNGQLRTLKATIETEIDSFFSLSIHTSLGQEVANFIALKNKVFLVDFSEKSIYNVDYNVLSEKIGYPITFSRIIDIFLGLPPKHFMKNDKIVTAEYISNKKEFFSFSYGDTSFVRGETRSYYYNYNFFVKSRRLNSSSYINEKDEKIISNEYTFNSDFRNIIPLIINSHFFYKLQPFEIEIYYKSVLLNTDVSYSINTDFISNQL